MTSKQRVEAVLNLQAVDRVPVVPIIHTGLARMQGVPLGKYFTDAQTMADVIVRGARELGLDGVQLTMGVAGEVEALGAVVEQPADGAPLIKQHPLKDMARLDALRKMDPTGGRMPMYHDAVARVVKEIGGETFVISTLRGPLNITSQLRGVEDALIDMIDNPQGLEAVLDFATDVAIACSRVSLQVGAHGLMFGEATCSPNFISPTMYRQFVHPRHVRLVAALRQMGWKHVGLHVCGNIVPIIDDLIATGANMLDIDYQVPAGKAIAKAAGRVALRGNLDPVAVFFRSKPNEVADRVRALLPQVAGGHWIISSGCDIPPGTPRENLVACMDAARG